VSIPTARGLPSPSTSAKTSGGWLERVRALQVIAQEGLAYTKDPWDRDRFARLRVLTATIAQDVLEGLPAAGPQTGATAGATAPGRAGGDATEHDATQHDATQHDGTRNDARWAGQSAGRSAVTIAEAILDERGYLTPKLDVRAAVHDESGRLLLVREVSDGRWALPGGWADVGETLAEGVVREVREETGFDVEVERLLGIYDRERWGHPPMLHYTLKTVVRCRVVGGRAAPSAETDAVAWFACDELPPLSVQRNSPELVLRVFAHHDDPGMPPDL
jgi:ADP-ribose pyrophosphatase YjhB (NUDIX family)